MHRRAAPVARIRLYGRVPRVYTEKLEITGEPASWMAPIGGVLARVEPKLRGEINLDPNVKEDDGICIVRGCLEPKIRCQVLRVDMTLPNGEVTSVITDTDERGCFIARFKCPGVDECKDKKKETSKPEQVIVKARPASLSTDQRVNCPPEQKNGDNQPPITDSVCVISFQAHIFNASQVAPTSSNIIHMEMKKD